ncbi:MAG: hypoxanthine phosphoribosyltransferase [Candidatus Tyrphobacter sp.]
MKTLTTYDGTIAREIYSAAQIAESISGLARRIAADFAGQPLLLLGVLKGALYVVTDLARRIADVPGGPSEIVIDYICVSSYGNEARSSGEVRLLKDTAETVTGRNVVIVEDIVDNGLTLEYLTALMAAREPAALRTCVLFDKPYRRRVDVRLDYTGLPCPDEFVVGYGLDYQELFRNLPYLAQLRPWVFQSE